MFHIRTAPRPRAQLSGKADVVPQSGALTVTPVAVATVVKIGERLTVHKHPVFQHSRPGIFDEPHPWLKILDNFNRSEDQGVRPN